MLTIYYLLLDPGTESSLMSESKTNKHPLPLPVVPHQNRHQIRYVPLSEEASFESTQINMPKHYSSPYQKQIPKRSTLLQTFIQNFNFLSFAKFSQQPNG